MVNFQLVCLILLVHETKHEHQAIELNFYISSQNKIDIVDVQNASLSGGVAVGAVADLMIQPYGAFFLGSLCGVVSTLGYRVLQVN